jgi:hypothetical protein
MDMSILESTNDQIMQGLRHEWRRRVERRRALRPIRAIDAILADLEEFHLAGRKRVPDAFIARIADLNQIIPVELRQEVRSRITIVHLMDWLYEVQDVLLHRKAVAEDGEALAGDSDGDHGGGDDDPQGYLPRAS